MLSGKVLKLYQYIQNFSYFIFASPAYFDPKKNRLVLTNSKIRWLCCIAGSAALLNLDLITIERYIWLATGKYDDKLMTIMCLVGAIAFTIAVVGSIIYLIKAEEYTAGFNTCLKYFLKFERKR